MAPKILMFDSGVGGLSVMQDVYKLNDQALFYYLFDHECFPYGNKSEVFLKKRVSELLEKICAKLNPDLVVIACNTASTIVLPTLRDIFTIPIVGVVPAIKPAAKLSKKHNICLLATEGTVHRAYTDFLINEFASDCKILKIGSQDLVRLAEEQLIRNSQNIHTNDIQFKKEKEQRLNKILEPILSIDKSNRPDVVVLGCTHFPLIKEDIEKVLGNDITYIDSGEAVGRRVKSILQSKYSHDVDNVDEIELGHGPIEAFYTGNCEMDEKLRLEITFKHFGFAQVSAFRI